jgi:hypothetical protein
VKKYTIISEVIKKVINDHGLECWWGVCGYGFLSLRCRRTLSVGVSVSSTEYTDKPTEGVHLERKYQNPYPHTPMMAAIEGRNM